MITGADFCEALFKIRVPFLSRNTKEFLLTKKPCNYDIFRVQGIYCYFSSQSSPILQVLYRTSDLEG